MFRTLYNQARILYRLEPVTGLLIKSGRESFDPTRPEMEFIRTRVEVVHNGRRDVHATPFVPGSSLKGVVRSHAERILRALEIEACDITRKDEDCRSRWKEEAGEQERKMPYKEHCYACRTFGDTELAGRVRLTDAYPWKPGAAAEERGQGVQQVQIEQRPGVKIDRRTGTSARGALFELEVVTAGSFYGEIFLRNYQLWQLALLALVLRDMDEGFQRVGAMKSRGLGRVKVRIEELAIQQQGPLVGPDPRELRGVGAVSTIRTSYGLTEGDAVAAPDGLQSRGEGILRVVFTPIGDNVHGVWEDLASLLIDPEGSPWRRFLETARRVT